MKMLLQQFSRLFSVVAIAAALLVVSAPTVEAQESSDRVFEIRTYTAVEGRLDDVVKRFRDGSMALLAEYGAESIGYWIPQDQENTLIYILAHPSREEALANWQAFFQDERWQKLRAESEANGPILEGVQRVFADPTDFSPLD